MDEVENVVYSSNDAFDALEDKDKTAVLCEPLDEVYGPQDVGNVKKYKLQKFVLNNDCGKRIFCLIWGDDLIKKHQDERRISRIIEIDGGHCKKLALTYQRESLNFVPFEITIQKSTDVKFYGSHGSEQQLAIVPEEVDFESIVKADGPISIKGFVKTKFVTFSSRFENSIYGCGSITDGRYKLTINISNYVLINIEKGVQVQVIGKTKIEDGLISVVCADSDSIKPNPQVAKMLEADLRNGIRIPKRLRSE